MDGFTPDERRLWALAAGVALAVHIGAAALVLLWSRPAQPPVPEPVVIVELPAEASPAPAVAAQQQQVSQPQPDYTPPQITPPPIPQPPVRAPMPKDAVALPPPPPPAPMRPAMAAAAPTPPAPPVATAPAGTGSGASATPGNDPKAKRAEADYFSLISAHLNRRKTYPVEAKKARQEGVVTVRFTVDRDGNVSAISLRKGSGHDILDTATLQLVQRVAPLPKMPASMARDRITLSLPIDYSLRTN